MGRHARDVEKSVLCPVHHRPVRFTFVVVMADSYPVPSKGKGNISRRVSPSEDAQAVMSEALLGKVESSGALKKEKDTEVNSKHVNRRIEHVTLLINFSVTQNNSYPQATPLDLTTLAHRRPSTYPSQAMPVPVATKTLPLKRAMEINKCKSIYYRESELSDVEYRI